MSAIINIVKGLVITYMVYVLVSAPLGSVQSTGASQNAFAITLVLVGVFALLARLRSVRRLLRIGLDDDTGEDSEVRSFRRDGKARSTHGKTRNAHAKPSSRAAADTAAKQRQELSGDLSKHEIAAKRGGWIWFLCGLVVVAVCLTILEKHQPYFFTQDDNIAYSLPLILQACKSAQHGILCTWNPYQLMGMPMASFPFSLYLYPPTYASYFTARYLLGNEYLTMEVLCIAHILLAYCGMYWLARSLTIRPVLAATGALSLVLSGYSLIICRGWGSTFFTYVWCLFLAVSVVKLQREPVTWKWILWTGAIIGVSTYAGYPQAYAYSASFFILAVLALVVAGSIPVRKAFWVVPALLIGLVIAAPALVPQLLETAHFYSGRIGGYGEGIQQASPNLLLPYPLAKLGRDPGNNWLDMYGPVGMGSTNYQYMGQFYYSGTFFYLVGFLIMLCSTTRRWNRRTVVENIWLFCALVALMFALGKSGLLWSLCAKLPVFSKFTGPFKYLGWVNLFVILGSAVVVERLLRVSRNPKFWETGIGTAVVVLIVYHCSLPLPALYSYGSMPYLPLPREMQKLLATPHNRFPQRIFSVCPSKSTTRGQVLGMINNWASVYGISSYGGYDPLVELTPENRRANELLGSDELRALCAYGVRWILIHNLTHSPKLGPNNQMWALEAFSRPPGSPAGIAELRLKMPELEIWEIRNVDPLAFAAANPKRALAIRFNGAGVRVDVSSSKRAGWVVVNYLKRPWIKGTVDGRPLRITADRWGRIRAFVPAGSRNLEISYSPPWHLGFIAAGAAATLAAAVWMILAHLERRKPIG